MRKVLPMCPVRSVTYVSGRSSRCRNFADAFSSSNRWNAETFGESHANMKIWVGVTDKSWYEHLIRFAPDEANFWQPSGSRTFRALQPGEPFLFKLHSPDNFIVGGG